MVSVVCSLRNFLLYFFLEPRI